MSGPDLDRHALKVIRDDLSPLVTCAAEGHLLNELGVLARISERITGIPRYLCGFPGAPELHLELIPGLSLDRLQVDGRPTSVSSVRSVGIQVALTLAGMHGYAVIHGDVKPANVMVDPDRKCMVIDFGASLVHGSSELQRMRRVPPLRPSAAKRFLGTPAYVSPEHFQRIAIGPWSDVYSLGAMLYELACGQVVFPGEDPDEVSAQHVSEPPRPISELVGLPHGMAGVIMQCLAKKCQDRPRAIEVARALSAVSSS